ncbi:histidinol-phosphatase [Fibrella sp. HMF5036]|uniref:protein-tyrosine-phosphatase n=2 Tax=Fibrella aquatilis TaxID=2817059 RepID=A0A939GAR2_9BACT|nr:histidinol-phosphatase [Fibrella aquatilis]
MEAVWMVDMHNHLLPGIDDGLTTLDDTMACLTQYAEWGIRRVICTPHVSQDYYPNTAQAIRALGETVRQAVAEANLPIDLTVAAEYLLDEQFDVLLRTDELLSFGSARYVLVETGWAAAPMQLDQWLFAMQLKGYTPVLAHPERYRYYQTDPGRLTQLRDQGCLLQLNLLSLAGRYGPQAKTLAMSLLQDRAISFVSSDLHRTADLAALQKIVESAVWYQLKEQPLVRLA